MPGLADEAATPRMVVAIQINQMIDQGQQFITAFENMRDLLLKLRAEISTNADGHFQPDDLGNIDQRIEQAKNRLTALANTFVTPP